MKFELMVISMNQKVCKYSEKFRKIDIDKEDDTRFTKDRIYFDTKIQEIREALIRPLFI